MEKLFKRADGYSETSSGDFAAIPNRRTGVEGDNYFFAFKPSFNAQSIRVEWPMDSNMIIIPQDVAITMIRLGHARNLSREEVDQYNESVDFDEQSSDGDAATAQRLADEETERQRLADAETERQRLADAETERQRLAAEEAEAARLEAEKAEGEDDAEKSKPGRKKKEDDQKKPLSIPGLTS